MGKNSANEKSTRPPRLTWVRWLAQRSANPGDGHKRARFDAATLDGARRVHFGDRIQASAAIARGRERLYCLRGKALEPRRSSAVAAPAPGAARLNAR